MLATPYAVPAANTGAPSVPFSTELGTYLALAAMLAGVVLLVWAFKCRSGARTRTAGRTAAPGDAGLRDDMTELTERLVKQLDERAETLERLIERADRRIEELERAGRASPGTGQGAFARAEPKPEGARMDVDPSHRAVWDLADAGLSPVDISKRLGKPTGQIELILNLRRASVRL